MKRIILALLLTWFLLPVPRVQAQEIDINHLVDGQQFSCEKIALALTTIIPIYYWDNASDSLFSLMAFWQHHCEGPEPLVRFRTLYTIETNTFSDDWYPDNILDLLYDYEEMVTTHEDGPWYYDHFDREFFTVDEDFSKFTRDLADNLKPYTDLQPVERFFVDFYSHDFRKAFRMLESGALGGTRIDSLYRQRNHRVITARKRYLGAYLGLWSPGGNLSTLGNHPQIGFFSGSSRNRAVFNFNFLMVFGNAANPYHVVANNTLFTSENYLSLHMGFDGGLAVVKTTNSALIASVGLAYEGFESLTLGQQEQYEMSNFIGTFNLNLGLQYRFMHFDGSLFGLQAKYHFVNYQNPGGTDFSGNVVTVGLFFGLAY
jgi:hypothetical protein